LKKGEEEPKTDKFIESINAIGDKEKEIMAFNSASQGCFLVRKGPVCVLKRSKVSMKSG
jgi:hypothetical protein